MKITERILDFIFRLFEPRVKWDKIDKSCIVMAEVGGREEVADDGWSRGWVNGPKSCVICDHANPSPGMQVHVYAGDRKIVRTLVSVDRNGPLDIALCEVDEVWPAYVKIYPVAKKPKKRQPVAVFHRIGNKSTMARLRPIDGNMFRTDYEEEKVIPGDSGMPWFIWEDKQFKVASHNHRGSAQKGTAYGPDYSKVRYLKN